MKIKNIVIPVVLISAAAVVVAFVVFAILGGSKEKSLQEAPVDFEDSVSNETPLAEYEEADAGEEDEVTNNMMEVAEEPNLL